MKTPRPSSVGPSEERSFYLVLAVTIICLLCGTADFATAHMRERDAQANLRAALAAAFHDPSVHALYGCLDVKPLGYCRAGFSTAAGDHRALVRRVGDAWIVNTKFASFVPRRSFAL